MTVFIQKFDYGITVIFEKINGNTVIENLVRPPPITGNYHLGGFRVGHRWVGHWGTRVRAVDGRLGGYRPCLVGKFP